MSHIAKANVNNTVTQMDDLKKMIKSNVEIDTTNIDREIYYVEPEYFDEERFIPYLTDKGDTVSVVPLYLYPDGTKKKLNIKTPFSQFAYKYSKITIDLADNNNRNLQAIMQKIDKKIYKLFNETTNAKVKLLPSYSFFASIIIDKKFEYSSIGELTAKISAKYNNTKITKHNSKSYIKIMESHGKKISEYSTIAGFTNKEFDTFIDKEFGKKYHSRCENYLAQYIICPQVWVFKNKLGNYAMFSAISIYEGEIKHNRVYAKSLIDKNEQSIVGETSNIVYI